jgi:hypothetical protein
MSGDNGMEKESTKSTQLAVHAELKSHRPKHPVSAVVTNQSNGSRSAKQVFEPLLNSREAAAMLRMHHKTLERKARSGEVPAFHIGGQLPSVRAGLVAPVSATFSPANSVRCELERKKSCSSGQGIKMVA